MKSIAQMSRAELAAFYHWGDRQALAQAVMVTHTARVDLSEIAAWSQAEGMEDQFKEIEPLLRGNSA